MISFHLVGIWSCSTSSDKCPFVCNNKFNRINISKNRIKKNTQASTYIRANWRRSWVDKCSTCAISDTKSECSILWIVREAAFAIWWIIFVGWVGVYTLYILLLFVGVFRMCLYDFHMDPNALHSFFIEEISWYLSIFFCCGCVYKQTKK